MIANGTKVRLVGQGDTVYEVRDSAERSKETFYMLVGMTGLFLTSSLEVVETLEPQQTTTVQYTLPTKGDECGSCGTDNLPLTVIERRDYVEGRDNPYNKTASICEVCYTTSIALMTIHDARHYPHEAPLAVALAQCTNMILAEIRKSRAL